MHRIPDSEYFKNAETGNKKLTAVLSLVLSGFLSVSGASELPPLRWVKPLSGIIQYTGNINDVSDSTFLYADALIDKRDGTVLRRVQGLNSGKTESVNDAGFVTVGGKNIRYFDTAFLQKWSEDFEDIDFEKVVPLKAGGYAALGSTGSLRKKVIRTDVTGTVLWEKDVDTSVEYAPDTIEQFLPRDIVDGGDGVVVSGTSRKQESLWADAWIIKFSDSGEEIWRRAFEGLEIAGMAPFADGIAVTGKGDDNAVKSAGRGDRNNPAKRTYFPTTFVPFFQIGKNGEILADTRFTVTGRDVGMTIANSGSDFLVTCFSYFPLNVSISSRRATVVSVNQAGEQLWSRTFDTVSPPAGTICTLDAKSFSSGAVVIAAFDSLYFHEYPANIRNRWSKSDNSSMDDVTCTIKSNRLIYHLSVNGSVAVELLDMQGRVIGTIDHGYRSAGEHRVRLSGLPQGSWLLKMQCGSQSLVRKMVTMETE